MARKVQAFDVCMACNTLGHRARLVEVPGLPNGAYICPMGSARPWGDVVQPDEAGRCGRCGTANFRYTNGNEHAANGIRGYRCVVCGGVKPER